MSWRSYLLSLSTTDPADGQRSKSWTFTDGCTWCVLNTWILPHKEGMTMACRSATSEQSLLWKVPLSLSFPLSLSVQDPFLQGSMSLTPHFLLYASRPLPLSALQCFCCLACSCLAQTRAKRVILALRPSKLSQLSPFSLLSANISSGTLLGRCYGHQGAG